MDADRDTNRPHDTDGRRDLRRSSGSTTWETTSTYKRTAKPSPVGPLGRRLGGRRLGGRRWTSSPTNRRLARQAGLGLRHGLGAACVDT